MPHESAGPPPLAILLRCAARLAPRVRYVFDTLLLTAGIPVVYVDEPPGAGPWLLYAPDKSAVPQAALVRCLAVAHSPEVWPLFDGAQDVEAARAVDGIATVFAQSSPQFDGSLDIRFDLAANAFYFLSSWSERVGRDKAQTRRMFSDTLHARGQVPQDIVDRYLDRLVQRVHALCAQVGVAPWPAAQRPGDGDYAVVLSHDVDFVPYGQLDNARQGAKTILRHLVRQRDAGDAARAAGGLVRAWASGRDPYGCVPEIIARERSMGVQSSFQVAVGHRHPDDVNYHIDDDGIRDYLRAIPDAGFDLCLHGSYRSTENATWYIDEVALLAERLGRPRGSRQHFLSFDYDALFAAQELAGIEYDMSMGFPDHPGPRAGFSHPYFPFDLRNNRPFKVLQISLFLMDVTLRGYMGLKGTRAWAVIERCLDELRAKRGCVSIVWHPIVFGGARDPGYDRLYWNLIEHVQTNGGVATDGRTVNSFWRAEAARYPSFGFAGHS